MVHRRKGRTIWEFKCPTRTGWVTVSSESIDKGTARGMANMVKRMGRRGNRDWDLLDAIADRRLTVAELYDADQRNDLAGLRERLKDVDLEPYLDRWEKAIEGKTDAATRARYRTQVETLIKPAAPFFRSQLTADAVDRWLTDTASTGSTRARYFAALRSFTGYLRSIHLLEADPLTGLTRPKSAAPRCRFLEHGDVRRVVDGANGSDRLLFAICYGMGAEVGAALILRRRDILVDSREIHLHGTKGRTQGRTHRDRIGRVADWAWPIVEAGIKQLLPDASLFVSQKVDNASHRHASLLVRLELKGYTLHDARHAWAVRMARAGMPAEMIARQLGHKDATMVVRIYGRFFPTSEEREKWEKLATVMDQAKNA